MNEVQIEAEIQVRGLTAPRLTSEQIAEYFSIDWMGYEGAQDEMFRCIAAAFALPPELLSAGPRLVPQAHVALEAGPVAPGAQMPAPMCVRLAPEVERRVLAAERQGRERIQVHADVRHRDDAARRLTATEQLRAHEQRVERHGRRRTR